LRQLAAPHEWGNPAGRVDTPASPVLALEDLCPCFLPEPRAHTYTYGYAHAPS